MRRSLNTLVALGALGLSVLANAQSSNTPPVDFTPTDVSVKVGVALPLDSSLTDVAKTFIGLGVEYQLPTSLVKGSESYLSLDWFTKSFRGERTNVFPLAFNQRFYTGGDNIPGRRRYVFVGAGVSFVDIGSSDTVISARAGIGAELSEQIFGEIAGYLGDQTGSGIKPNVVSFFLGYKF